jgi:hypothetical protein
VTAIRVLLAAALAGAVPGCSFIWMKAPPPPSPSRSVVDCRTTPLPPILDTIAAGIGGYIAYKGLVPERDGDAVAQPSPERTLVGLGTLGLFGASAVWGYVAGAQCREVKATEPRGRKPRSWDRQRAEEAEEEAAADALARQRQAAPDAPSVTPPAALDAGPAQDAGAPP